ncbi:unnamed protein product [Penicillium salamii]|nr:unnamed protein product [Penicillium salamii]
MEDVPITAKWANRILRPLTSICRRLENHHARLSALATESKQREAAEGRESNLSAATNPAQDVDDCLGSDAEPERNDPVWVPGRMHQRRARLKYSSRSENNGPTKRNRLSIHSPDAPRTLPGAIEVATPLITGERWEMPLSTQSSRSIEPASDMIDPQSPTMLRGKGSRYISPWRDLLEKSGDEGLVHIAHNLDRVLKNFLLSTQKTKVKVTPGPHERRARRGARSLMSMAMRQLPAFIAKEQEAQDELDEDGDEDMCDAYFTELEAYYAPHGAGWEPLREAVRAQGIDMVARMIKHNWITESIACALIEGCRTIAPEESDSLLSIILSTRESYPYPQALKPVADSNVLGDPILFFWKYASHGLGTRPFIFDELAKLLLRGILPPEWMGTRSWTSWMTRATISFSKDNSDCPAASRLIEAVILSASSMCLDASEVSPRGPKQNSRRKPVVYQVRPTRAKPTAAIENTSVVRLCPAPVEDALSNQVISLIAALCGIHISRSRASTETEPLEETKASRIIGYLHFVLQQAVNPKIPGRPDEITSHQLLRRGSILLAASLVQCNNNIILEEDESTFTSTANMDECARSMASRPDLIRELALLVQEAFRCLRARSEDARRRTSEDIRRMVSKLASIAETSDMSVFLGKVAAEAAMTFAEATADTDDHLWAVEVQEMIVTKPAPEDSDRESSEEPESSSQPNGLFRWEESIGEWVETTPAAKRTLHIAPKGRAPMRMLSSPASSIPCSTDCSSPEPDSSEEFASKAPSSASSSPTPEPKKRAYNDIDVSHIQPNKRRRPTPVVVCEKRELRSKAASPAATMNRTVESANRRGILRERSTNLARQIVPTTRLVPKVVIINSQEPRPSRRSVQPSPERGEKQIHRTLERRRPTRFSAVASSNVRRQSSEQTVIPCSQDSDSDDELSFL